MMKERMPKEEKGLKPHKVDGQERRSADSTAHLSGLSGLQRQVGNQAVQRLLAQRRAQEPSELDQETTDRINRERGGGQPLDASVEADMGEALGADLSGVNVHTSSESDALNRQLGAQAFTTGQDVFFRSGAYEPHSTDGQQLIAHELTHVVQQGAGLASNGGRMAVNAPGDVHEQQADATARAVVGSSAGSGLQRQMPEEEEIQAQEVPPEEEIQTQEVPEEEEVVQPQEEEEEELQP